MIRVDRARLHEMILIYFIHVKGEMYIKTTHYINHNITVCKILVHYFSIIKQ